MQTALEFYIIINSILRFANSILRLPRNHKSIFSPRFLFIESKSILPNLSLVMKFLGHVFTNSIFEILLSHEALVTESVTATTTSNNQTQPFKPL